VIFLSCLLESTRTYTSHAHVDGDDGDALSTTEIPWFVDNIRLFSLIHKHAIPHVYYTHTCTQRGREGAKTHKRACSWYACVRWSYAHFCLCGFLHPGAQTHCVLFVRCKFPLCRQNKVRSRTRYVVWGDLGTHFNCNQTSHPGYALFNSAITL